MGRRFCLGHGVCMVLEGGAGRRGPRPGGSGGTVISLLRSSFHADILIESTVTGSLTYFRICGAALVINGPYDFGPCPVRMSVRTASSICTVGLAFAWHGHSAAPLDRDISSN